MLALLAAGCASPTTPSAVRAAPAIAPTRPMVVAGQSNAVNLAPYLRAIYPLPVYSDASQNGAAINVWSPSETPPVMWPILADELRQPVQAFVWWQGEADRDSRSYPADATSLFARVRAQNGDPQLLVVLVRVLDLPQNVAIRSAQEAIIASDPFAVLVSSDGPGFQDGTSDHLTTAGYEAVAARVLAALR